MARRGPGGFDASLSLSGPQLGVAVLVTAAVAVALFGALGAGVLSLPDRPTETARTFLQQYGLVAVAAAFVLEGALLLVVVPNESIVPVAILVMGDSTLDVAAIVAVAVAGATVGQTALFLAARYGGRKLVVQQSWIGVSERRLDRFDEWFERWGPIAVPASNTMLFVRGMLSIPAGLSDMAVRTFVVLSALGTLAMETLLAAITVHAPDILAGL